MRSLFSRSATTFRWPPCLVDRQGDVENQWQSDGCGILRPPRLMGLSDSVSHLQPQPPRGERILNITINGENLDLEKDYTVAASSFLLEGGEIIDETK